jgi:hypothetical protein
MTEPNIHPHGAAIAALPLSFAMLSAKNRFTKEEKIELLDGVLQSLEAYALPNDLGVQSARRIVDGFLLTVSKSQKL